MQSSANESGSSGLAAKKIAENQPDHVDKLCGRPRSDYDNDATRTIVKSDHDTKESATNYNERPSKTYWHYKQTGIKSRPIKLLKHPIEHIERKIILTYLLGFLFRFIAIITGPFIVLSVYLLTLPIVLSRRSIWFLLNLSFTFDARIKTVEIDGKKVEDGPRWVKQIEWHYCPLDFIETYWFKEKQVNNVILAIEHKGRDFSVDKLRSLVKDNILSKPEYRKFLSRVVTKGLPLYKSHYWHYIGLSPQQEFNRDNHTLDDLSSLNVLDKSQSCETINTSVDQFSVTTITNKSNGHRNLEILIPPSVNTDKIVLEDHIFIDEALQSSSKKVTSHVIRDYAYKLLDMSLNMEKPLWELRMLPAENGKSYLIFRCHQSLADGKHLSSILTDHLAKSPGINLENQPKSDDQLNDDCELKHLREKKSFISRMSRSGSSKSAILVGPLTVLLWLIWTFTRRRHNHLNKTCNSYNHDSAVDNNEDRRFYMTQYSLTKFYQIKQMTRSTVSDVILCALSGAIRDYLRKMSGVPNPPNLNVSLAVDMRQKKNRNENCARFNQVTCDNSVQAAKENVPNVNCTLVNVPLPTSIEGTVPRLWEIRSTMDELRTSADPWVMLGLQYFLHITLPTNCYQWVINYIALRNSSAILSNIRGPQNMVEAWCIDLLQRAFVETQQVPTTIEVNPDSADYEILLYKGINNNSSKTQATKNHKRKLTLMSDLGTISAMFYCMQPPSSNIPISINCITYHDKLSMTILSRSLLIEDSKLLTRLIFKQLDQLADTIAKRRSLVTIMRAPVPIEISCEPATPLIGLDQPLSNEDKDLVKGIICRSQPRLFGSHKDDIEAGVGMSGRDERCKACHQTVCSCRRRKSLFSFDFDRQHILHLLNPIQSKNPARDCGLRQSSRSSEEVRFDAVSGQQFLEELDEEANNSGKQDGENSSTGSRSPPGDDGSLNTDDLVCRKIQKRSTTSLHDAQTGEQIKRQGYRHPNSFVHNAREIIDRDNSNQLSLQLTVPHYSNIGGQHHSRSENDLQPKSDTDNETDRESTNKSRTTLDNSISKNIIKQQSSLSSGASSRETIAASRSRNTMELKKVGRRNISKRRKSVAIGSESTHVQRFVVIKDKINADVSLRYQLDGPFSIGIRNRRTSNVVNAASQRRASLIPFGLMSNQSFPKLFCDDGVEL